MQLDTREHEKDLVPFFLKASAVLVICLFLCNCSRGYRVCGEVAAIDEVKTQTQTIDKSWACSLWGDCNKEGK